GILAALDLRFGHAQGTQLDAAHDGIEGDAAFDLAELIPQTVLEDVGEYEAVEDDQRDETPDRVGEVLLDLHRHGEGDDEDEDGSRDEDLTDREPGIDVVADVTALGALVTPGEVLLLPVHHSDARTLALLTLLLLGRPVRDLAVLVGQGLAAQWLLLAALGRRPSLLLLRVAPSHGVRGGIVFACLRGGGFVLRARSFASEHLINTTFGE